MHLRFGSHSLERTQHGPESKYLEQATPHDNLRERYSTWQSTFRMQEFVTENTHSSHRWFEASWFPPMTIVKMGAVAWPV